MSENNLPALAESTERQLSVFSSASAFETAQRMAKALAASDLVPTQYKGDKGVANCLIALEIAQRTGSSIMAVMQNGNIIHNKFSWSSSYIIGAINGCGRYEALKFKVTGEGMAKTCVAWTKDRDGQVIEGPPVSMQMANDEGWINKTGSKWKTMPDLMLRYRAASFFGRLYASDVLLGMQTEDEMRDVSDGSAKPAAVKSLNEKIRATKKKPAPVIEAEAVEVKAEPEPEPAEDLPQADGEFY